METSAQASRKIEGINGQLIGQALDLGIKIKTGYVALQILSTTKELKEVSLRQ